MRREGRAPLERLAALLARERPLVRVHSPAREEIHGQTREEVENCRPSLRFSVTLYPGLGEVLLKRTCHSDDLLIHFALAQERFC